MPVYVPESTCAEIQLRLVVAADIGKVGLRFTFGAFHISSQGDVSSELMVQLNAPVDDLLALREGRGRVIKPANAGCGHCVQLGWCPNNI